MEARSRRLLVISVTVTAAIVAAVIGLGFRLRPYIGSCEFDHEIAPYQRDAIDRVALKFADRALGPDPASAFELVAASAREAGMTAEKLGTHYQQQKEKLSPVSNWHVAHTYLVKYSGTSDVQQILCGRIAQPEERVILAAKAGPPQAHVVVEGQSARDTVAFVLWMVSENGEWRALEAHESVVTYMGKSAVQFEEMANAEQRERRFLNAALLYLQAQTVADRGPRMQLGILQRIAEEFRSVKVPGPLAGEPPFMWRVGDTQFKVLNVAPVGLRDRKGHDKLWVAVTHEIDPWVDEAFADGKNRDLIEAFRKKYPSYRRHFSGLVMRGQQQDHGRPSRGWGTVQVDDESSDNPASADEPAK